MKLKSTSVRIIAALTIVLLVLMALPAGPASAAITVQSAWANLYAGAAYPGTYTYTVANGSQRMLVVGVSSSMTGTGTQTASVTYGGQALTLAKGDAATTSQQHTYLFYLQDNAVMTGSPQNLVVSVTGGTSGYNFVYAAVYAGVDQSASPITSSANFNSLTTPQTAVGPLSPTLTVSSGDQAVEIINLTRTSGTSRTISTGNWDTNWSSPITNNSGSYRAYIAVDGTAGTTSSSHTASGTTLSSMTAMSIKSFAVSTQQTWTNLYAGAAYPGTYSYTVNAGINRMLVVGVSSSMTGTGTQTASVTYGGQALTLAKGDAATTSQQHTYLFYLQDNAVMTGSPQNLVVSVTGGTSGYNFVYAAVYAGVDQSASPITSSANFNSLATPQTAVGPLSSTLTVDSGDQAVEIINLTRTSGTSRTISTGNWDTNWSSPITNNSGSYRAYIAVDGTAGTTSSSHTASGTTLSSMTAMSIKRFVAPPTPTATAIRTNTPTNTPTFTRTFTPTFTLTPTFTMIPLVGGTYVRFSAMLLNAPDFGLDAQTVSGRIGGGVPPYTVRVYVKDPDGIVIDRTPPVTGNTFEMSPAYMGDPYFGCSKQGVWSAWFEVQDSEGHHGVVTTITWTVSFPRVHAIP